jgi:predicted dehydrogenase
MATDLRIALIGCGSHGSTRLAPAVWHTDGVTLSACVDVNAEAARKAAHGVAEVLDSVKALTAGSYADAAVIAVPHDELVSTTRACLEADLHVLVEKPAGVNANEASELVEIARASGLTLMPAYCLRFNEVRTRARDLIRRGVVGNIRTLAAAKGSPPLDGWLADPNRGGGQLLFLGSHLVDQLLWLHRQAVVRVYATMTFRDDTGSDESTAGVIEFADGVCATISVSQAAGVPYDHLEITGDRGRILSDWMTNRIDIESTATHEHPYPATEFIQTDKLQPMYDAEMAEFAAAVHIGRQPSVDGHDAIRTLRVLDALRESALSGAPVAVDDEVQGSPGRVAEHGPARIRIQLTYPSDRIQEPILYEIARRFHLKFNVRRADIDAGIGWVQLMLEGERSEIESAIEWVEAQGIRADPVEGDIVSG